MQNTWKFAAFRRVLPVLATTVSLLLIPAVAAAQPADSQVLRDMRAPGQLSIRLLPAENRPERTGPRRWEFLRGVVVTRASEYPGINLSILSQASYISPDGRRWRFVRSLTTSNSYVGLPDPTAAEISAAVRANIGSFFGPTASTIVGRPVREPELVTPTQFEWPTLNSVTFGMTAEFDQVVSSTTVQRVRWPFEVTMSRTARDQPWSQISSSPRDSGRVTVSTRELPAELVSAMTRLFAVLQGGQSRTVDEWVALYQADPAALTLMTAIDAERARFRVSAQPSSALPNMDLRFPDANQAALRVREWLFSLSPVGIEGFLRVVLSPRHSMGGTLTPEGIDMVSNAVFSINSRNGDFRNQFCENGPTRAMPDGALELVGNLPNTSAIIQVEPAANEPGRWYISRLELNVRHDAEVNRMAREGRLPRCR